MRRTLIATTMLITGSAGAQTMDMTGSGGGIGLNLSTLEQLTTVAVAGFVVYQGKLAGNVGLYRCRYCSMSCSSWARDS